MSRRRGASPGASLGVRLRALPWGVSAWIAEGLGLTALVAILGYALVALPAGGVATIRVEGSFRHVAAGEIRAALAGELRGDLWRLDLNALRDHLRALPWVREATLRRVWPARLVVRVTERRPLARWNQDSLLERDGVSFAIAGRPLPAGLPALSGPAGSAGRVLAESRAMARILEPAGLHLVRVRLDARGAWFLGLEDGVELVLGKGREREARLRRFARVYRVALGRDSGRIAQVDLRYGNGFALRRTPNRG